VRIGVRYRLGTLGHEATFTDPTVHPVRRETVVVHEEILGTRSVRTRRREKSPRYELHISCHVQTWNEAGVPWYEAGEGNERYAKCNAKGLAIPPGFSVKMTAASPTIHGRFMTPTVISTTIKPQQQPTQ
jgi:hypothetical protein